MLDTPLLLAHQAIRRLTSKALSNLALSPDEARVLEVVGGAEHPTMGQVAGRAGLTLSALSKLADRLEAAGLLRRERADEDGRGLYAVLTDDGNTLLGRMWPVYARTLRESFVDSLSDDEAAVIARSLARVASNARGAAEPG